MQFINICIDRFSFTDYHPTPGKKITGAGKCEALGRGSVQITFLVEGRSVPVKLTDVIHAPDMPNNLISIARLTDNPNIAQYAKGNRYYIKDLAKKINIATGMKEGHLYRLYTAPRTTRANAVRTGRSWYEWHCALGHINKRQLYELKSKDMVLGMDVEDDGPPDFTCDSCTQAKHSKAPYPEESKTVYREIGELIVSDIWGPARTERYDHSLYFITFTDAFSRRTQVYFLKSRDGALDKFKIFRAFLQRQVGKDIKVLRTNNARELSATA